MRLLTFGDRSNPMITVGMNYVLPWPHLPMQNRLKIRSRMSSV
jgi:hypothetical protein